MIISALLGAFGGLLIGGRFKVYALLPVLFAAVAVATVAVLAGGLSAGAAALSLLCFVVSLQAGYAVVITVGAAAKKPVPARPLTT